MTAYSTEQLKALARSVIINNPKYMKMDGGPDANGLNFFIDVCCELPLATGAQWKAIRHWIAVNAPGLLDRTPSPDNILRRGREVREEVKKSGGIRPPAQLWLEGQ